MATWIDTGRESPEYSLPSITEDVIQTLGEKKLKYFKKPSRKFTVKRPVFNVYVRMKTDRKFRKEYISNHKLRPGDVKQKMFQKGKPKCKSVLGKPVHRLPPIQIPSPPSLSPVYEPGGVKYHQKRVSEPVQMDNTEMQTFDETERKSPTQRVKIVTDLSEYDEKNLKGWGVDDTNLLHNPNFQNSKLQFL